jgi:hypothetical protein
MEYGLYDQDRKIQIRDYIYAMNVDPFFTMFAIILQLFP